MAVVYLHVSSYQAKFRYNLSTRSVMTVKKERVKASAEELCSALSGGHMKVKKDLTVEED